MPIGAEQTSSGYDVVWKNGSADQYVVWSTDSNGNYVSSLTPVVSGTSATLESYESIFHQDLNGDGTISAASQVMASSDSFVFRPVAPQGGAPLSSVESALENAAPVFDAVHSSALNDALQHLVGSVSSIETAHGGALDHLIYAAGHFILH
ncbi:hypothetical protein AC630_21495 [Bradyrhizobium sp. AS23.2]|nr:hypothetical protein AC630_21495 [Bradyrhizobium sp. AS23.2]